MQAKEVQLQETEQIITALKARSWRASSTVSMNESGVTWTLPGPVEGRKLAEPAAAGEGVEFWGCGVWAGE